MARALFLLFSIIIAFAGRGESVPEPMQDSIHRPIRSTYTLEAGAAKNISTYLSPLYYKGQKYALSGSWEKIFNHWGNRWDMRFEAEMSFCNTHNPANTAQMIGLTAQFNWGLLRRFHIDNQWKLWAGATAGIYGGALYLTRNGNNPVTALASGALNLEGAANFQFRIRRLPVSVTNRISIPTLSLFFSPEFGETYYEIWLGNHHGLAHCGWWGNAFGIDNLLTLNLNFGRRTLLLGYRYAFRTFHANHLNTNLLSNSAVIGISF